MAGKACHVFRSTTLLGLTLVLGVVRKISAALLSITLLSLGGCTFVLSPRAYLERRACLSILPGTSAPDVLKQMGTPQEQVDRSTGERVLYYRWLFNASGPIYVVLGKAADTYTVGHTECEGSG
ncbi:hypothetical protein [uncultured Luteimonas sp.]|uniref:hypothetical protein n=1 Tax=uncultured Luteimonas sp. TaxID=453144 RepID=UPI00261C8F7F|nr:hypothetical protein [uncultured Luteimonas sp.]